MKAMGKVANLFRAPKRREPMEELSEVLALADAGFEGCSHARPGSKRQVLLVDRETLDAMNLVPGIIRENVTTEGIDVNRMRAGQSLRVGTARLEVAMVCAPCELMEKIRPGLQKELEGRRGMLCRVIEGGSIRCGDIIEEID
jgi:MOSC domain-containing protein YiiM